MTISSLVPLLMATAITTPITTPITTAAATTVTVTAPDNGGVLLAAPGQELALHPAEPGVSIEVAMDGGLLQTAGQHLSAPAAGDHWLALVARDAAGNRSAVVWRRLRVDGTPPGLSLQLQPEPVTGPAGSRWLPPAAEVELVAEDELAGVAGVGLVVNGKTHQAEGPRVAATLPIQGEVTITATAWDRVGNRGQLPPTVLAIDSEPPTGRIELRGRTLTDGDRLLAAPAVVAEALLNDQGSGVGRWQPLHNGSAVAEEQWQGPWPAGRHRLGAQVCDRVGSCRQLPELLMEVDETAPRLSWSIRSARVDDDAAPPWVLPPVRVEVTAHDELAGLAAVEWSAQGRQWQPAGSVIETGGAALQLRATDRLGNLATVTARWRLDTSGPRLVVHEPETTVDGVLAVAEQGVVRIVAEDDGCGVETVLYRLNGKGRWQELPETFSFQTAGSFALAVQAVDRLGNRSEASWQVAVGRGSAGGGGS